MAHDPTTWPDVAMGAIFGITFIAIVWLGSR